MTFVVARSDGIPAVDAESSSGGTAFEDACDAWSERALRLSDSTAWLEGRGCRVLDVDLSHFVWPYGQFEHFWTALIGDWELYADEKARLVDELAAALEPPQDVWGRWSPTRRATFAERCGAAQRALGFELPAGSG
jgi:hypothetical protein